MKLRPLTAPLVGILQGPSALGECLNPSRQKALLIPLAQDPFAPCCKRALTLGAHCGRMQWDSRTGAKRRPDKQVLFVVQYRDGSRSFMRVPPRLAMFGVSPPVLQLARERQSRGELPAGDIATLVRAH